MHNAHERQGQTPEKPTPFSLLAHHLETKKGSA